MRGIVYMHFCCSVFHDCLYPRVPPPQCVPKRDPKQAESLGALSHPVLAADPAHVILPPLTRTLRLCLLALAIVLAIIAACVWAIVGVITHGSLPMTTLPEHVTSVEIGVIVLPLLAIGLGVWGCRGAVAAALKEQEVRCLVNG